MLPWKQFIAKIHEDNKIALQFHIEHVSKTTLLVWQQHFECKCEQRNKKADKFYDIMVTRRSLTSWRKVGCFISVVTGCHGYNLNHPVCKTHEIHQ